MEEQKVLITKEEVYEFYEDVKDKYGDYGLKSATVKNKNGITFQVESISDAFFIVNNIQIKEKFVAQFCVFCGERDNISDEDGACRECWNKVPCYDGSMQYREYILNKNHQEQEKCSFGGHICMCAGRRECHDCGKPF